MVKDQSKDDKMAKTQGKVDDTLADQDIDQADLISPASQKAELGQDITRKPGE